MPNRYIYVTYGVSISDIHTVKSDLERLFDVTFEFHESDYWGEYYLARFPDQQNIKIGFNFVDDDWREENHKEYPILLELNELKNIETSMDKLNSNLIYVHPIRRVELEPGVCRRNFEYIDSQFVLISENIIKTKK